MPKPEEDSDDAPPPKKTETKRKQKPDAAGASAPKKASGEVPAKKLSGESAAKKVTGEVPVRKLAEGDGDPPPKTKTKRVAKPVDPEAEAPAAVEPAPEPEAKSKTGKRTKLEAPGKAGAAGKKRPRPGGERAPVAPPAPATRGAFDYVMAILGPIVAGGFGGYAFMTLNQAKTRYLQNPIFAGSNPTQVFEQLGIAIPAAFPWAGIVAGVVIALLGTLVLLKMAPGMANRIMGVGLVIIAIFAVLPFFLSGRTLDAVMKGAVAKEYLIPRGAEVDVRALDMKPSKDYPLRQLLSVWKVYLEEGETPVAWLTNVEDTEASKDEALPENERILTSADLRTALLLSRSLEKDFPKEIEELKPKLEALRDKCADATKVPTEESLKLKDAWTKFEGLTHGKLMKPPAPKNGGWFTGFTTFGELGQEKGTSKADHSFYFKRYLGKAVHKACPWVPAEMRYAGAFIAYVPVDYVGKDPAETALTRYDRVFVCYDIENLEREPVVIPYIKGILDEARFRIEVLGEK